MTRTSKRLTASNKEMAEKAALAFRQRPVHCSGPSLRQFVAAETRSYARHGVMPGFGSAACQPEGAARGERKARSAWLARNEETRAGAHEREQPPQGRRLEVVQEQVRTDRIEGCGRTLQPFDRFDRERRRVPMQLAKARARFRADR